MTKVTYLSHSGFLVEMPDIYFLFDYYKGELPKLDREKKLLVFVSHVHYDHYNKEIFGLTEKAGSVTYILSSDILKADPLENEKDRDIVFFGPNEEKTVGGCGIRTLRSTDEGVAYLIHYQGKAIYHAGDLNWWHWEGEPEKYNTKMRRAYQTEINKLHAERIDLAFVPVDPRLGEQYCLGLDCFMKRTDTRWVVPMHFWGNYNIFDRLSLEECTKEYRDRIVRLEREGQVTGLCL